MRSHEIPNLRLTAQADAAPSEDSPGGIFSALIEVYRGQGFEQGYEKAMSDVLGSLVHLTEQYLDGRSDSPKAELRRIVYGYVEHLQSHIRHASNDAGFVSGGLGI